MQFSIIIPAYNASKTIGYCLNSVISQDFPAGDFEVIVVDDCSTDGQNDIINKYARITPPRIVADSQLITKQTKVTLLKHTENKRQGGARNTALLAAHGEWILFLDADDYWRSKDVLKTFHRLIEQYPEAEIFESKTYISSAIQDLPFIESNQITSEIKSPSEYYSTKPHPCIWAAVYFKNSIKDIPFRENVYYEDTDWKIRVFTTAKKIVTFDFPFYVYFQNSASTTTSKSVKAYEDAVTANIICRDEWQKSGLPKEQVSQILASGKKYYINSILDVRNYSISDSRYLLGYLRKSGYENIVKKEFNLIERIISCSSMFFPLPTIITIKVMTAIKRFIKRCKQV